MNTIKIPPSCISLSNDFKVLLESPLAFPTLELLKRSNNKITLKNNDFEVSYCKSTLNEMTYVKTVKLLTEKKTCLFTQAFTLTFDNNNNICNKIIRVAVSSNIKPNQCFEYSYIEFTMIFILAKLGSSAPKILTKYNMLDWLTISEQQELFSILEATQAKEYFLEKILKNDKIITESTFINYKDIANLILTTKKLFIRLCLNLNEIANVATIKITTHSSRKPNEYQLISVDLKTLLNAPSQWEVTSFIIKDNNDVSSVIKKNNKHIQVENISKELPHIQKEIAVFRNFGLRPISNINYKNNEFPAKINNIILPDFMADFNLNTIVSVKDNTISLSKKKRKKINRKNKELLTSWKKKLEPKFYHIMCFILFNKHKDKKYSEIMNFFIQENITEEEITNEACYLALMNLKFFRQLVSFYESTQIFYDEVNLLMKENQDMDIFYKKLLRVPF